jgi:transcriptional regulator of acetoin/glycerol metabolism
MLECVKGNSYGGIMARPAFTPDDEQRKTLDVLARIAAARARLDDEADATIKKAKRQDIPVSRIAETLGVERKTVYRHLGRPMK